MNQFEKTYLDMINPNGKFEIYEDELYNFLECTIKIKNSNLISEAKKSPGLKNFYSKILNAKFNEKISFNEINSYFKNELETVDERPIVVFKLDFEKPEHISWILNEYQLTYGIKEKSFEEIRRKETLRFKTDMENTKGAITQAKNAYLLFLNTNDNNKANDETVQHEIEHYLQYIGMESLVNGITLKFGAKNFKMSLNDVSYYLSDVEFIPNIKVNLVNDLKKIYAKEYYNKISKEEFLNLYFSEIENDPLNILNSDIGCVFRNITGHHKVFSILPICKLIKRDDLLNIGIKLLKENFK